MPQPTTARLDLSIWRNDDVYEFPLRVIGPNLTGVSLRAQIRMDGDTPGPALVALETVTNGNAEGVRLASVTLVDGRWINDIRVRINKSTRQALPYLGELGSSTTLKWALAINRRTRIDGQVELLAHVMDSNAAPSSRPLSYGYAPSFNSAPAAGATLTIAADQVAELVIDGADLIERTASQVRDVADGVAADATLAGLAAATAQAASRYYPTRAAGEAASQVDQSFSTDDGGVLISYRRTAAGSVEISRSLSPAALLARDGAGRVGFGFDMDGAVAQDLLRALRQSKPITPYDFGAAGVGNADQDDVAMQRFWEAARNRAAFIPSGRFAWRTPISLDPDAHYHVTACGYDIDLQTGAILDFRGQGHALSRAAGGVDKLLRFSDFALVGTRDAENGVSLVD